MDIGEVALVEAVRVCLADLGDRPYPALTLECFPLQSYESKHASFGIGVG